MEEKIMSLKKLARQAGLLYLVMALTAPYAHMYVPSKIYLREDSIATTNNILNYEFLFRTCIVANLVEVIFLLLLGMTLYRLFSKVNLQLSRLLMIFIVVQVPIVFLLAAFKIAALMIAKGEITPTFFPGNVADVTMLFLKLNEYGMVALEVLWGLWLIPFGMLAHRSRFIPRFLGVLLMLGGAGYVIDSLTFMLIPQYASYTRMLALVFSGTGEISILLWFLVKGVKSHISIEVLEIDRGVKKVPAGIGEYAS
jgi:hypothetical protein